MQAVIVVHSLSSVTSSRQEIEDQVAMSASLKGRVKGNDTGCKGSLW